MKKLAIFFTLILALVGCSSPQEGNFTTISLEEGYKMIQEEDVKVLDVRTVDEFESGHILNAVHIPVEELEERLVELDKNQAYFVICRSGNRSKTASKILADQEFKKVYNAKAGMSSWEYEIE